MRLAVQVTPALINAVIHATIPQGWHTFYSKDRGGYCLRRRKCIVMPRMKHGYRSLWVYLHELGHARRMIEGRFQNTQPHLRMNGRNSNSFEEFCAEEFAMDMLVNFGFPITPTELANAKSNVRQHVKHETRLGLPVYEGVRKFARSTRRTEA